jgi:outer membrane protein assembly factor BamE (lipoprotein component of BamABCDE complex)
VRWIAIVSALALAACSLPMSSENSPQRETQESINQKIAKGKTTKDQVKAAFGEPGSTTTKPNGSEEWSYKMANSETSVIKIPGFERFFGSGTEKAKTLLVDFDRRGIVANYSLNEESK